jgi:outer membrane protein
MRFSYKINYKKSLLLKSSIFALSLMAASNSFALTLEEALGKAYSTNPELLAQRESLKAVNQERPKAMAGFLPTLTATSSRDKTTSDDPTSIFGNNPRGLDKDYYTTSNSVQASQNLFNGGETYYSLKAADERINAARFTLEKSEQEFLFFAIQAYVELIHAKKVLELTENNEKVLREQLSAVEERFNVGDATKTDVSQSEARFSNSTSARVIAEGDFIAATARFRRLYQIELPEDLQMPSNLPKIPETLEASIELAKQKNYDIRIAEFNKSSSSYEIKTARAPLLPQVSASASMSDREFYSSASINESQTQVLGLTVTVPIFDGGLSYANVRQAKDRARQNQYNYENVILSTKNGVIDAWQSIITTDTNIQSTKKSLEASEVALNGVKEEQKEGTRTILDVLDAEQEKFQSEVAHARAIKDSVLAVYRLKGAIGELTPEELNLGVAKYDQLEHYNKTKYKIIGF